MTVLVIKLDFGMKKKIAVLGSGWAFNYILQILKGIQEAAQKKNADIYFFTCYKFHNPDGTDNTAGYRLFDLIDFKDFDGVILLANLFEDEDTLQRIAAKIRLSGIPAVTITRKLDGFHFLHIDNYIGFYDLVNHLVSKHKIKNLAYLGGIKHDRQSEERYKAFETVVKENKLSVNKNWVFENGDWSFKFGYDKGIELFNNKRRLPEAIICSNDPEAFGVIRAADECGIRIPQDVKVIGFDDDIFSAQVYPSLSTVSTKPMQMGFEACNLILNNVKELQNIEIPSEPVYRQSCGCNLITSEEQRTYPIRALQVQDAEERFMAHIRHTEDVFINDDSVHMFWDTCQQFYEKRHYFEGEDFAILLKSEFTRTLTEHAPTEVEIKPGDELRVFVNLKNGKSVRNDNITTKQLMPENLLSSKNNTFVFFPLVYHNNFYGYYVGKNNLRLIENKRGYPWTKNFANSIEKFREKTKYRLLSQKYLDLSTKDALSGVFNRAALDLFGNEMYETNRHSNLDTAIYFLDINDMKIINDKHGHLHGDLAVKIVAEEIKSTIPDSWIPIRYGGDEFVILGPVNAKKDSDCLQNINDKLAERAKEMSLPYTPSVSVGYSIASADSIHTLEQEINIADKIMYQAKQKYHGR